MCIREEAISVSAVSSCSPDSSWDIRDMSINSRLHHDTACDRYYHVWECFTLQCTVMNYSARQRTARYGNARQPTGTHGNTPQHTTTHRNTPQHTATYRNALQNTATHRNTPQHTCSWDWPVRCRRLCSSSCVEALKSRFRYYDYERKRQHWP